MVEHLGHGKAVNDVTTPAENACGMNPNNADTDGDGLTDTLEFRACANFDGTGGPDANDTDSDADGILDNLEDKNFNGRLDSGETDRLGTDTDGDGIADGTEDADHDGVKDAAETSPIDRDTDDDGIGDYLEIFGTWCYIGESIGDCAAVTHSTRYLTATSVDTDGDGVRDGVEIGLTSPGEGTLASAFVGDSNPATVTNPKVADSDTDSVWDGTEDINRNGRLDSGEADPKAWDTDRDGLPDGRVDLDPSEATDWKGEDLNNNGVRDQDGEGEWNETDFLANDSDVDGVFDGAEKNGTYCFKVGANPCANTGHALDPLNADSDGDQLRDGQELAGWVVGVWYERTMEKKENVSVVSLPWAVDSESDNLTDFQEFMNGSNPQSGDTDGDLISDWWEIERKSNITGIEGTPPQISNVRLDVGIDWDWWGFLYLPLRSHVTVSFDVSDNVGVARVDVKFIRYSGTESVHLEWTTATAPQSYAFSHRFDFSIAEALVAGADVNITAFDVNENGAWGDFHVKSVLEAIADAIAAFLSAIAKIIVEAASAAFAWIWDAVAGLLGAVFKPIIDSIQAWANQIGAVGSRILALFSQTTPTNLTAEMLDSVFELVFLIANSPLWPVMGTILTILNAVEIIMLILTIITAGAGALLVDFAVGVLISFIVGAAVEALGLSFDSAADGIVDQLGEWTGGLFLLRRSPFDGPTIRGSCTVPQILVDLFAVGIGAWGLISGVLIRNAIFEEEASLVNNIEERAATTNKGLARVLASPDIQVSDFPKVYRARAATIGNMEKVLKDTDGDQELSFLLFMFGLFLLLAGQAVEAFAPHLKALLNLMDLFGFMIEITGLILWVIGFQKSKEEKEHPGRGNVKGKMDSTDKAGGKSGVLGKVGLKKKIEILAVVVGLPASIFTIISDYTGPCYEP